MGIKLSLHKDISTNQEDWYELHTGYSPEYLEGVLDPSGSDTKKLLTAIPSPFARMHLVDTAFKIINQSSDYEDNSVFHKIISDCFDLFEIIFNYYSHIQSGEPLSILFWDRNTHLGEMITSTNTSHNLIGQTLQLFLEQDAIDANFANTEGFYLIIYQNELIGATSPITGFFTKPDIININLINPSNNQSYFSNIIPLHLRSNDFQIYIHRLFKAHTQLNRRADSVFKYVNLSRQFIVDPDFRLKIDHLYATSYDMDNLKTEYTTLMSNANSMVLIGNLPLVCKIYTESKFNESPLIINSPKNPLNNKPIVEKYGHDSFGNINSGLTYEYKNDKPFEERVLPDNRQKYPYVVPGDFLNDFLIKVDYPININRFSAPKLNNIKNEDFNYLLPINLQYFEFFNKEDLVDQIEFSSVNDGIKVTLNIPTQGGNPVVFEKYYYENPAKDEYGKIIDCKFNLAFFPFFKVKHDDKFNDYYKILFLDYDSDHNMHQNYYYQFKFYKDFQEITDNKESPFHFDKMLRNKGVQSSIYYELNTCIDLIEILVPDNNINAKGIIIPLWKEIEVGPNQFSFAVDFGTTNSHIAFSQGKTKDDIKDSFTIGEEEKEIQVICFNAPNEDSSLDLTQKYEEVESTVISTLIPTQLHEFIPSIIGAGNKPKYSFPIRTAISEAVNLDSNIKTNVKLLSNINISFIYQKEGQRPDEEIFTNLKWSMRRDNAVEIRVENYIKEILYLIRNKILLNSGNPSKSKIIWFYPLSMDNYSKNTLSNLWETGSEKILCSETKPISITESQAPFYFHKGRNDVFGDEPVLSIDIGGGSTDVVFFEKQLPKFGTSFNYAGNAIWGSGFNYLKGQSQGNGIVKAIGNSIADKIGKINMSGIDKLNFNSAYEYFLHSNQVFSEEIMNFYFTWDKFLEVNTDLKKSSEAKLLILMFYLSILYHSFQIMKFQNLSVPKFVCLSGMGSRALKILDPSSNKSSLIKISDVLIDKIFGNTTTQGTKIITTDKEKEATCIGGILMHHKDDVEPESLNYIGNKNEPIFNNEKKMKYNDISAELKKDVVKNVSEFIEIAFGINNVYNFKENFGIDCPLSKYKKFLLERIDDSLQIGLDNRLRSSEKEDVISETLFFYALKDSLYKLSIFMYE